ncbi:MAG: hypothetical protein H6Q72_4411, partial [Firmicutes bacterium]|nr:hypothetical protein [Bacillota bacterium]
MRAAAYLYIIQQQAVSDKLLISKAPRISGMLPLDRTMKKQIVLSGGNFMPHKEKVSTALK